MKQHEVLIFWRVMGFIWHLACAY